jgi:hypothetical protein
MGSFFDVAYAAVLPGNFIMGLFTKGNIETCHKIQACEFCPG